MGNLARSQYIGGGQAGIEELADTEGAVTGKGTKII